MSHHDSLRRRSRRWAVTAATVFLVAGTFLVISGVTSPADAAVGGVGLGKTSAPGQLKKVPTTLPTPVTSVPPDTGSAVVVVVPPTVVVQNTPTTSTNASSASPTSIPPPTTRTPFSSAAASVATSSPPTPVAAHADTADRSTTEAVTAAAATSTANSTGAPQFASPPSGRCGLERAGQLACPSGRFDASPTTSVLILAPRTTPPTQPVQQESQNVVSVLSEHLARTGAATDTNVMLGGILLAIGAASLLFASAMSADRATNGQTSPR